MSSLGRHLSVTPEQAQRLLNIGTGAIEIEEDRSASEVIEEELKEFEEGLARRYYFDTDKAWDPIHRALTLDDTPKGRIDVEAGDWPLCLCIFGGEELCGDDYTARLVLPDEVAQVASALAEVEEAWLRTRFFTLDAKATLYAIDEDEWDYAWSNFRGLPEFFARAAAEGRAVIFTVAN